VRGMLTTESHQTYLELTRDEIGVGKQSNTCKVVYLSSYDGIQIVKSYIDSLRSDAHMDSGLRSMNLTVRRQTYGDNNMSRERENK
jgi:hypothetical protein